MKRWLKAVIITILGLSVAAGIPVQSFAADQVQLDASIFTATQGQTYQIGVENYPMKAVEWTFSPLKPPTDKGTTIVNGLLTIGAHERSNFIYVGACLKADWLNCGSAKVLICPSSWDFDKGGWPKCWSETPTLKTFSKTYQPKISGKAQVGRVLTVKVASSKPAATTKKLQWYRGKHKIVGATQSKYRLTGADYKQRITVRVTVSRTGYTSVSRRSTQTAKIKIGIAKKGTVQLAGTSNVGRTLTAKTSRWSPSAELRYQWYRSGRAIAGAHSKTYVLTAADRGLKVQVRVRTSKQGYNKSVSRMSKPSKKVGWGSLVPATPTISGVATVGQTLRADHGRWKPSTTTFTYQWMRNGQPIAGATHSSLPLTSAEAEARITVRVTGLAAGYRSASRTSGSTSAVAPTALTPPPGG